MEPKNKPSNPKKPKGGGSEYGSQQGVSRRDFLELFAQGAAIVGAGAMGISCVTPGLSDKEIANGLKHFSGEIDDPNNYMEYLRNGEFVIKNEIFEAYARTVDKRPTASWSVPMGGYIEGNYLNTKEEVLEFEERLKKLNLTNEEIEFYKSLFSSSDIIIFREEALEDKKFLKGLAHERFHQEMKKIGWIKRKMMQDVVNDFMRRWNKDGSSFITDNCSGFCSLAVAQYWEEFYTYLAHGKLCYRNDEEMFGCHDLEELLKKEYPEAYAIYDEIRNFCKVK